MISDAQPEAFRLQISNTETAREGDFVLVHVRPMSPRVARLERLGTGAARVLVWRPLTRDFVVWEVYRFEIVGLAPDDEQTRAARTALEEKA